MAMCVDGDQLMPARTQCCGLRVLLLLLLAAAVPAAAAPVTSTDVPTASTGWATVANDEQLLESLPEKERVALMAFDLAAALQRLAEQAAGAEAGGDAEEEGEATARIVTREDAGDALGQQQPPATTPLLRALSLQPAAKRISLSENFQSTVNRWVHATSNATYYKVMKVRAKITICFPFNVCFEIQDPWGLCCPF